MYLFQFWFPQGICLTVGLLAHMVLGRTSWWANTLNWKLRANIAHSFLAGWLGKDSWDHVLKYKRNIRKYYRNKRGLFPEGSFLRVSDLIILQLKPWKVKLTQKEEELCHLWESWGLSHLFSISSAGMRAVCAMGSKMKKRAPGWSCEGPLTFWESFSWRNWGMEDETSLSPNSFKNEFLIKR